MRLFSLGLPVSSTNKTDLHDIAEILLKVALNTIRPTQAKIYFCLFLQTKEKEIAVKQLEEEVSHQLSEKEEEMKLAVEERDLQKMAAMSQQDTLRDQLQDEVNVLSSVS